MSDLLKKLSRKRHYIEKVFGKQRRITMYDIWYYNEMKLKL